MQPALVGAAGTPVQRLRPQVRAVQRRQMRVARQHDRELVLVEYVLVLAGIVALQDAPAGLCLLQGQRSEEHTSELQSLMRISYAGLCFKKKNGADRTKILLKY